MRRPPTIAATKVADTKGRAKKAAPISMCDGVFVVSAYWCLTGFFVFRNAAQESIGNCAIKDSSSDREPRRANKPENICESSGPIKVCLDVGRRHITGKLIDVKSDVGGYAQDACRVCNQWCPREAT